MVIRVLRFVFAGLALLLSVILFYGFVKIAGDYNWAFNTQVNFGDLNGTPVLTGVWAPLVICLILAMGALAFAGRQLSKVIPSRTVIASKD
jgi:hypothetical protein